MKRLLILTTVFILLYTTSAYAQGDSSTTDTLIKDLYTPIEAYVNIRGNLRAEPIVTSDLLGTVERFKSVTVLSYIEGSPFIRVEYEDIEGWINYMLLSDRYKTLVQFLNKHESTTQSRSKSGETVSRPEYPHGRPDDTNEFKSGNYHNITYIYHCYRGRYLSYSYVREYGRWKLDAEYSTSGICH